MKYIFTIILLLLLLLFPQKAYCGENISLSFIEYDDLGNFNWRSVTTDISPAPHIRARLENTLNTLFTYQGKNIYTYPENISVRSIHYLFGCVTLDLSPEFNNFGGGSSLEGIYLGQIVKTLLDIEGVEKVTLLVDGLTGNTPEGIVVKEVYSWQELTEGKIMNTAP